MTDTFAEVKEWLTALPSEINLTKSTVHSLTKQWNLRPYWIKIIHKIFDSDKDTAKILPLFPSIHALWYSCYGSLLFADEVLFHLDSYIINTQNCGIWVLKIPISNMKNHYVYRRWADGMKYHTKTCWSYFLWVYH